MGLFLGVDHLPRDDEGFVHDAEGHSFGLLCKDKMGRETDALRCGYGDVASYAKRSEKISHIRDTWWRELDPHSQTTRQTTTTGQPKPEGVGLTSERSWHGNIMVRKKMKIPPL